MLKEKHASVLSYLPKQEIDGVIEDLSKVCATENAHVTYKQAGWKSTFMKYKNEAIAQKRLEDQRLRDICERELYGGSQETNRNFFKAKLRGDENEPQPERTLETTLNIESVQNLGIDNLNLNFATHDETGDGSQATLSYHQSPAHRGGSQASTAIQTKHETTQPDINSGKRGSLLPHSSTVSPMASIGQLPIFKMTQTQRGSKSSIIAQKGVKFPGKSPRSHKMVNLTEIQLRHRRNLSIAQAKSPSEKQKLVSLPALSQR